MLSSQPTINTSNNYHYDTIHTLNDLFQIIPSTKNVDIKSNQNKFEVAKKIGGLQIPLPSILVHKEFISYLPFNITNEETCVTKHDFYYKGKMLSTYKVNGDIDSNAGLLCLGNAEMISPILNGSLGMASENVSCPGFAKEAMVDILGNMCQTVTKYLRIEQVVDRFQNNGNGYDQKDGAECDDDMKHNQQRQTGLIRPCFAFSIMEYVNFYKDCILSLPSAMQFAQATETNAMTFIFLQNESFVPIQECTKQSITGCIQLQSWIVDKVTLFLFMDTLKLSNHFEALCRYYLMNNGVLMNRFCVQLYKQQSSQINYLQNKQDMSPSLLNLIFSSCVKDTYCDNNEYVKRLKFIKSPLNDKHKVLLTDIAGKYYTDYSSFLSHMFLNYEIECSLSELIKPATLLLSIIYTVSSNGLSHPVTWYSMSLICIIFRPTNAATPLIKRKEKFFAIKYVIDAVAVSFSIMGLIVTMCMHKKYSNRPWKLLIAGYVLIIISMICDGISFNREWNARKSCGILERIVFLSQSMAYSLWLFHSINCIAPFIRRAGTKTKNGILVDFVTRAWTCTFVTGIAGCIAFAVDGIAIGLSKFVWENKRCYIKDDNVHVGRMLILILKFLATAGMMAYTSYNFWYSLQRKASGAYQDPDIFQAWKSRTCIWILELLIVIGGFVLGAYYEEMYPMTNAVMLSILLIFDIVIRYCEPVVEKGFQRVSSK